MLSIYTLKSAAKAGNYYQQDNYYAKEGEPPQGIWFGDGAKMLNLNGAVKLSEFVEKLEGKLGPNITMPSTTKTKRPGYDLTFSAPKSVSILAVIIKDEKVLNAHRTAVDETLKYLEQRYAATRVRVKNKIEIENTNNLLITKFEHTDSRALDPNLHTHCIVMNTTLRSDQKWRSLYFDSVYDDKMLLGVIYRGRLAQELMKSGFEIVQTSEKGLFELKGFPELVIKQFSKRREQITKELEQKKLIGSKAAQIANFNTRGAKKNVDPEHLDLAWTIELQQCGSSIAKLQEYSTQAKKRGPVIPPNPYYLADQAITKAAKELSERQTVFAAKELIRSASGLSISNYSPMLLEKALAEQFKSGQLIYLKNDLCTTQEARDLEILNVINMRQDKNKILPMFNKLTAVYLISSKTNGSKNALVSLLTNTDRQIVVTATNAANYTNTIKPLVEIAYEYGFYPVGITQFFKRTESFKEQLGIKRTQTISGFLKSCAIRAEKTKNRPVAAERLMRAKQIWILDFESNISAAQINVLQTYAKQFGTRIIWSNNIKKPKTAINTLMQHKIKQCNLDFQGEIKNISSLMDRSAMDRAALNCYINSTKDIDKSDWQANIASVIMHWVTTKYQQRDAVFSLKKLQLELFSLGITVSREVLENQLKQSLKNDPLIEVSSQLVTTENTVNLEYACLDLIKQYKQAIVNIMDPTTIDINTNLTKGQQQAIQLILTTTDRIVGVQGVAGSGKTTMLRELNKLCNKANFEIIGLTVTTSAKERLLDSSKNLTSDDPLLQSGIRTFTLRRFLIDSERLLRDNLTLAQLEYGVNKLYILDEASFVSTEEMFSTLIKMNQLNARIVVMGDYRQLGSVDAGRIFYLMLGSKMQSVAMTENVRFKSNKALAIMQNIYNDNIPGALKILDHSLIEIPDHQERLMKMVQLYVQRDPTTQANTILITPEHVDRIIVNQEIRRGLKENGQLIGTEIVCRNLTQISLTKAEQQKIYYFNEQDWVVFSRQKDQYFQIKVKNLEDGVLVLEDPNTKQQMNWSPERQPNMVNIYHQEERSLMQNDQIRWLKNGNSDEICNGQKATVLGINQEGIVTVKLQNGNEKVLNLMELTNQHWDYAYAATAFVAQGADQPATIALVKGGYGIDVTTKNIKIDDVIMIKQEPDPINTTAISSKWVKVLNINESYQATVQDRNNNTFNVDLTKSPTDNYIRDQAVWCLYPDPTTRKLSDLPRLTSVSEFLVMVTRGDQVTVLVDHLESYQHTLQTRILGARSAFEYLDPDKVNVQEKVFAMTKKITGLLQQPDIHNQLSTTLTQKNSLYNRNLVNMGEVISLLHSKILQYAINWLGRPQKISGKEARWGKKGSLVVKLTGVETGYWHDFESGKGGKNLLSLYQEKFNVNFKTAIADLSREFNIKLFASATSTRQLPVQEINKKQEQNINNLVAKKISYAKDLYNKGIPIKGTLAEKYLREFRGITGGIPLDFKFCAKLKHPDLGRMIPALLAPIKNVQGEVQGVVRIFLNSQGNKLNTTYIDSNGKQQVATVKANLGSMANAAVIINQAKLSSTVYIAEGIETALSINQAQPSNTVFAALSVSNLTKAPLPVDTQKIILCSDNDGVNAASNKALISAANFYLARGLQVAIAHPEKIVGMNKIDFNDVLKNLGTASITRSLQSAVLQTLPGITKKMEPIHNKELSL
jgi:conjugative relaxase-like TrwC/TraI family protein